MIAFRNSGEDDSEGDKVDKDKIKKSLQKLLDIIYNDPEFYQDRIMKMLIYLM